MATKLQREILWGIKKAGGKAIFQLGHKSTDFRGTEKTTGAIVINCSEVVFFAMKANHFVEKQTQFYANGAVVNLVYILRPEGIIAAGLKEPDIRPRWTGGTHGPRWS